MTQLTLDIEAEFPVEASLTPVLHQTVSAVLAEEKITGEVALTILLTDDEQMQQLNRDFADLDEATDVLSFSAGEPGEIMPDELTGYLGDIAISMMKATNQAEKGGHSLTAELQLLTVHGVLHLLGHDHYDSEEKARMWSAQKTILEGLKVDVTIPD